MNRFLARTLSTLNAVFALLIIVIATASGATGGGYYFTGEISIPGAILGGLGGVLVAALVCGAIAFLTLIERHLSILADAVKRNGLKE